MGLTGLNQKCPSFEQTWFPGPLLFPSFCYKGREEERLCEGGWLCTPCIINASPFPLLLLILKDPSVKIRTAEGTKYKPLSSPPILVTLHLHLPESNFHLEVCQSSVERKSKFLLTFG